MAKSLTKKSSGTTRRKKVVKTALKPRRPKQTPPKPKSNPRTRAPRGRASAMTLDPRNPVPIPSPTVDGTAFVVKGSFPVQMSISASTAERAIVFLNTSGDSGSAALHLQWNSTTVTTRAVRTFPTLALADDAGGPTSGRAMKLGADLVNTTQLSALGGRVWVVPLDQRLRFSAALSTYTSADLNGLADALQAHPASHDTAGEHYAVSRSCHLHPVDDISYRTFNPWVGTSTVDEFGASIGIWPAANPRARPMSTIAIVFDAPSQSQVYTLNLHGMFYTRWAVDTVLGQSQAPIPTAPATTINAPVLASATRNSSGAGAMVPSAPNAGNDPMGLTRMRNANPMFGMFLTS